MKGLGTGHHLFFSVFVLHCKPSHRVDIAGLEASLGITLWFSKLVTFFFFYSLEIMNSALISIFANNLPTDPWLPHVGTGLACWLVYVPPSGVQSSPFTQRPWTSQRPGRGVTKQLAGRPYGIPHGWSSQGCLSAEWARFVIERAKGKLWGLISDNISSLVTWVTFSSNLVWSTHQNQFLLTSNKVKWGTDRLFLWCTYVNWQGKEDSVCIRGGILL